MQVETHLNEDQGKKDIARFNQKRRISYENDNSENLHDEQTGAEGEEKYPIDIMQCDDSPR